MAIWPFQVTEPEARPEGQTLGPPARCAQLPGRLLSLQRKQGSGPPRSEPQRQLAGPPLRVFRRLRRWATRLCSRARQLPLEGLRGVPEVTLVVT